MNCKNCAKPIEQDHEGEWRHIANRNVNRYEPCVRLYAEPEKREAE